MLPGTRALEVIGYIASERKHLEETGSVQLVYIQLERGVLGEARTTQILVTPRKHQAGKVQREAGAQLVGVHYRIVALHGRVGLPFIRPFHLQG